MNSYKPLQELTIKDNFLFGAVMCEEENCRRFLEMLLGFPIQRVEVSKEKSIAYHPEYKGVRLDVYAKDEEETHYNVEMQAIREDALGRRSRYYHSQLDMELLDRGLKYSSLPHTYVIFICDFDPFGAKKYCYTFESRCRESPGTDLEDGRRTIFLSTRGKNDGEVPETMVKFLKFVSAGLKESMQDFGDDFVRSLQSSVQRLKSSRELEGRYMLLQEILEDKYAAGKVEGKAEIILELLSAKGQVPTEIHDRIMSEKDISRLEEWFRMALGAETMEDFIKEF